VVHSGLRKHRIVLDLRLAERRAVVGDEDELGCEGKQGTSSVRSEALRAMRADARESEQSVGSCSGCELLERLPQRLLPPLQAESVARGGESWRCLARLRSEPRVRWREEEPRRTHVCCAGTSAMAVLRVFAALFV